MRYWWVNQNQTFRQETAGGYLWSPKRNANGARNPFYETMREVSPGDVVFSFVKTPAPSVMRASLVFGSIGRIEQAHGQTPVEIETNVDRSKGKAREPRSRRIAGFGPGSLRCAQR